MQNSHQQIVPGISVTSSGQATVDPSLADVLFDLAIELEGPTNLPVDVEHVLATFESEDISRSSGLPCVFGYTPDGTYIIVVYELIDDDTLYPVTAYAVPEP